ncbi:hypothetical protein Tco_1135271 [Tanacetum coccineum]
MYTRMYVPGEEDPAFVCEVARACDGGEKMECRRLVWQRISCGSLWSSYFCGSGDYEFVTLTTCCLGQPSSYDGWLCETNAPYYNAYLEMVAKHDHKITAEEGGKKKSASKADQSKKPATSKKPKPVSSKQSKPAPAKQPKPVKEKSTKPLFKEKASKDPDIGENNEQKFWTNKVDLEEKTVKIDEGQAGSNPGKTPESLPPLEHVFITEDQAGPNPGQHLDEEHVHLENPQSSTRTLSSMKNLDNFTFGDQFIADKSSKDETRNANMETKVESMTSSAWKTSDTRNSPSKTSKQRQPLNLNNLSKSSIPDGVHNDRFEGHRLPPLSKIKTIPNWLKLVPEEDRLKTPEPDWTVPPNDLPEHENNWANAFATLYKDPEENKLL